jgi:hypothetical protein
LPCVIHKANLRRLEEIKESLRVVQTCGNPSIERTLSRGGHITDMNAAVINVEVERARVAFGLRDKSRVNTLPIRKVTLPCDRLQVNGPEVSNNFRILGE